MTTGGLATAVALAGGIGEQPGDDAQQLDAFDVAGAALPIAPAARGKSGDKGGRPAGARNKSTEEFRQYFLSRYRSPVVGLAEIYSRSAEDLARELKLTRVVRQLAPGQQSLATLRIEDGENAGKVTGYLVWDLPAAFDRQQAALVAAAPYIDRKQPIAIDTGGKVAGVIVIGDLAGVEDQGDGTLTLDLTPEQNQQVSEDASVRLSEPQSHDEPKQQTTLGKFSDDI